MDKYQLGRTCPKCNDTTRVVSVEYHGGTGCGLPGVGGEHMHRKCGMCGYEWAEAPLS